MEKRIVTGTLALCAIAAVGISVGTWHGVDDAGSNAEQGIEEINEALERLERATAEKEALTE